MATENVRRQVGLVQVLTEKPLGPSSASQKYLMVQ